MTTPQNVEEMVEEFERNHPGTMRSLIGADIKDWLRTTLAQYGNQRYEEGVRAERERVTVELSKIEYKREQSLISPLESYRHSDIEYGYGLAVSDFRKHLSDNK